MPANSRIAAIALLVLACGDSPADPGDAGPATLNAEITGAEAGAFDGRSYFHLGSADAQGRAEFTLSSLVTTGDQHEFFLLHGEDGLPAVGSHPIGLSGDYRMFFHRGNGDDHELAAYVAEHGELVITHASSRRIDGRFDFTAFRYCRITVDSRSEGACTPPAAPIPGAPRVTVTGSFSAMNVADIPVVDEIRPGTVSYYHQPVVIELPASVQNGTPIRINVRTYGGGCTSRARTEVRVVERRVVLQPLNFETTGKACPDLLATIDHTVEVTFDSPGAVSVQIQGWSEPAGEPVAYERTVQVQ